MTIADAATDEAAERLRPRLARHMGALAALAWPVMLSRAGILLMSLVDVVMLGRYDTLALAEASVALGLFVPVMVTGVGLQMGTISIVSRRHGASDVEGTVAAWRRALPWAALTGAAGAALLWFGEDWLRLIGQEPRLVEGGGAVSRVLAPGLMLQVLYVASAFYMEGTGRPKPALYAMAAANVLNVALNWLLIYGNAGAPELGAVGSAWATTGVRVFLVLLMTGIVLTRPEVRAAGRRALGGGVWGPGGWAHGAEMRRLGAAAGLSVFFETTAFGALIQMAGLLGAGALAAYSIAHNLQTTIFMTALGLGVASGVRAGGAAGAERMDEAAFAGWTGLAAAAAVMGLLGLGLVFGAEAIVNLYTEDAALAARAAPLLAVAGVAVVPHGMQIVMGQCNRALGDAFTASSLYLAAYWGVLTPAAWALAFPLGYGAAGLVAATGLGAAASVILQGARFRALCRRDPPT